MQEEDRDHGRRWWRRGAQTARHTYFTPTSNRQGVLLFLLIAGLGIAAMTVAALHMVRREGPRHNDGILAVIGLGCVLLGLFQALRLARRSD